MFQSVFCSRLQEFFLTNIFLVVIYKDVSIPWDLMNAHIFVFSVKRWLIGIEEKIYTKIR